MGAVCTRGCRFCDVVSGRPLPLDRDEPRRIAEAIGELGVRYVVITSVDRDDLEDLGAGHFAETIRMIHETCPDVRVEVLTPDFQGRRELIGQVLAEAPDVFAHNLETVRRLTPLIRDRRADYDLSLEVLRTACEEAPEIPVKTGIMVGLGESDEEVYRTLEDARGAGAVSITIGQYLAPTPRHAPVKRYVHPDLFRAYSDAASALGFEHIASGPMVRSSYRAEELSKRRNNIPYETP